MARRFNPAPGWPQPPAGWEPPAGWQPDPSWPPAPPGWQFWLEDAPAPAWQPATAQPASAAPASAAPMNILPQQAGAQSQWGSTGVQRQVTTVKSNKRLGFLPGWRVFTYVILGFNLLMLIWIIGGASSAAGNCDGEVGDALAACEAGTAIGAGIGIFFLIVLWALGDIILGVLWLVTNRSKRSCPACGNSVKKGLVQCSACGFDFRQAGQFARA